MKGNTPMAKDTDNLAAITKNVAETVMNALKPQIEELARNQKILADTIASGSGIVGADGVKKLIADDHAAREQTAQQKAAREAFIKDAANGIAKLPAAYVNQLGTDPAKWADEAKRIAGDWKSDAQAAGFRLPDTGGAGREGGDATGDGFKTEETRTAAQLLAAGLQKRAADHRPIVNFGQQKAAEPQQQ
jgi:hypothetical protein